MDLYLDQPQEDDAFIKEAAFAARLGETPENWPQELTSELMKQLPFLSDYDVNVNLDRVDPQRGFAFGYADVANKTERPEVEHEESGLPHIRIPLIVMEKAVKPFSVFLDGEKVLPLTEERIREILFNPSTFDISATPPRDPSLVETLMPPQRSGIGMGGEYKMASVQIHSVPGHWEGENGLAHAIDMLSGRTKLADYGGEMASSPVSSGGIEGWLSQFQGTPIMERALEVEKRKLHHDIQENQNRQVEDSKRNKQDKSRDAMRREGDAIHTQRRGLELELALHKHHMIEGQGHEKTSAVADLEKIAFSHISKPQWEAIYKSTAVQKAVQKYGGPGHPQVTNKVYETAAKHYGYHPKVLDWKPPAPGAAAGGGKAAGGAAGGAAKAAKPVPSQPTKQKAAGAERKSLLRAIAPTIREQDVEAFTEKVASSPFLIAGFRKAGAAQLLVDVFEKTKRASVTDCLLALADAIEPSALTIQKLPGGDFLIKHANVNAFMEKTAAGEVAPHEEAASALGEENAQQMEPGQTATVNSEPVEETAPTPPTKAKVVEEFGQYKVQDSMGNSLLGHVFPVTMAWDGNFTEQPIALFTNGSAYALQEAIAGELVGKGVTLPSDSPRGDGVFYTVRDGEAVCTAPITIASSMAGPDGLAKLVGSDAFGNQIEVSFSPGLTTPTRISDVEYALPDTWKFMRLNGQTQLIPDPAQMNKQAQVAEARGAVTLFYNGSYNFRGACGLEKISSSLYEDLDPVSAEFMLGVLGVPGHLAKVKVAEARRLGHVKLANLKTIRTLGERYQESMKTASALLEKMPNLARDLIKEAAEMKDEDTVDNLLSLNFINPENLSTFIGYMPQLEETSEHLAEMLLYSYMGEKTLPEGAIDRSMKNLEEVLVGLKAIAHSEE